MSEIEEIYNAYRDAQTWIEFADQKIRELESKMGNKEVVSSLYDHNSLMMIAAGSFASFFEQMEEEGSGDYVEILPSEVFEKHMEGRDFLI
jgi:hypothetical protein